MKMIKFMSIAMLLVILPAGAMAFDASKIRLNGFVSQGYLDSSENNFLDPTSMDGTFQLNEVGLTISAQATDKLRIGMQLLSRDLGQEGNNDFVLDWAFGDYRVNNLLGVRAGKIKMPMGLYNEGRDSDMLRDMVFLPQSIYDETWRSFMGSAMGVGVYGNISLGGFGDLDYQAMTGEINISDDVYLVQVGIVQDIESNGLIVNALDYETEETVAASLVYNTPLDGLRFGATYLNVEGAFQGNLNSFGGTVFPQAFEAFTVDANIKDKFVVSAEYTHMMGSLRGEYMEVRNDVGIVGHPVLGSMSMLSDTAQGYYVLGTIPISETGLKLSALYDVYYANKDVKDNGSINDYRKDLGIGIRYDIASNWIVKAEYHDVEGAGLFLSEYNSSVKEDWNYFVAKTTFFF